MNEIPYRFACSMQVYVPDTSSCLGNLLPGCGNASRTSAFCPWNLSLGFLPCSMCSDLTGPPALCGKDQSASYLQYGKVCSVNSSRAAESAPAFSSPTRQYRSEPS